MQKVNYIVHLNAVFEKFNNDDHGLMPVHCEIVNSFIYICVAEQAPDFEQFRQDVSPFIAPHNLENCKVAHEANLLEKGNWKLVFENNRECYHCDSNLMQRDVAKEPVQRDAANKTLLF